MNVFNFEYLGSEMPRYSFFTTAILVFVLFCLFTFKQYSLLYLHLILLYWYSLNVMFYLKKIPKLFLNLALLLLLVSLSETLSYILSITYGTNHPVYHFTVPALILGYGLFFAKSFSHRRTRIVFNLTVLGLILLSIGNSLFLQSIMIAPSYGFILLSFFVIICSLFQLKKMINNPISQPISRQGIFWFSVGNLVFYSINFTSFGLHAVLTGNLPEIVYDLVMWLNLILYFTYFSSIYLSTQPHIEK